MCVVTLAGTYMAIPVMSETFWCQVTFSSAVCRGPMWLREPSLPSRMSCRERYASLFQLVRPPVLSLTLDSVFGSSRVSIWYCPSIWLVCRVSILLLRCPPLFFFFFGTSRGRARGRVGRGLVERRLRPPHPPDVVQNLAGRTGEDLLEGW